MATALQEARTLPRPLRVYRVAAGLSQEQLAERAHVARITVGALERGENVPQLATARGLAAALDVPTDVLFPPDDGPAQNFDPEKQRTLGRQPEGSESQLKE